MGLAGGGGAGHDQCRHADHGGGAPTQWIRCSGPGGGSSLRGAHVVRFGVGASAPGLDGSGAVGIGSERWASCGGSSSFGCRSPAAPVVSVVGVAWRTTAAPVLVVSGGTSEAEAVGSVVVPIFRVLG